MYVTNVTDYDNMTDDYKITLPLNNNCTNSENNIDIIIPTLFSTLPCGLSIICLISLVVYTLHKPLLKFKKKYLQLEQ